MPTIEAIPSYDGDGEPSRPPLTEDGKGGTLSILETRAGAHRIYYRLYTNDGPLESNKPVYSNDRFIGTISSKSLRPPKSATSLKKYLCKIEGLGAPENCTLYQSLSDETALEDSTRLSFEGTPGPGSSDRDPMALVIDARAAENRSQVSSTADLQELLRRDCEPRYVYYLVYDGDGEAVPKTSFDEINPYLGRVNTFSIPPPHTVATLKHHLIKAEKILGCNFQLFKDENSKSALNDSDTIPLLADTFPGFVEDKPIAMAYESQRLGKNATAAAGSNNPNDQLARDLHEARSALASMTRELQKANETHARELHRARSALHRLNEELTKAKEAHECEIREARSSLSQLQAGFERPSLTKKLKATKTGTSSDPAWHSMKKGDMFYTDGIFRRENYRNDIDDCYLAISSSGKLGFADADFTTLC